MSKPRKYVEFESSEGKVLVEVESPDGGHGPRAVARGDGIVEQAGNSFEATVAGVKPIAEAILKQVIDLSRAPQSVEVRFGIKLSGELGVILASSKAEAHCEIKLAWQRQTE